MPTNKKKAILFVSRMPEKGFSGGRYLALLSGLALSRKGHDVSFHANHIPSFYDELAQQCGALVTWHIASFDAKPVSKADIVILIPDYTDNIDPYLAAYRAAEKWQAKTVMFCFETPNFMSATLTTQPTYENWQHWHSSIPFTDLIVTCTALGRQYAQDYFNAEHVMFRDIKPCINAAALAQTNDTPKNKRLVFVTRFAGHAAHKGAQEIENFLNEKWAGYEFALIRGTDNASANKRIREIQEKAKAFSINVTNYALLSEYEKFGLIKASRATIFPSKFEGFGYPPIESFLANTPVIHYDLPIYRETLPIAEPLAAPLGDAAALEALAAKICLGSEAAYRLRLPENDSAFDALKNNYSIDAYSNQLETMLEELIVSDSRRPALNVEFKASSRQSFFRHQTDRLGKLAHSLGRFLSQKR